MAVGMKAQEVLDKSRSTLPLASHILDLRVEDYTDADGDEALRVDIVLKKETDWENIPGKDYGELKQTIADLLLVRGIELFPYVFMEVEGESDLEDED